MNTNQATTVAIGQTGAGKSCFLNSHLGIPQESAAAFATSDGTESQTQKTEMKENLVDGFIKRAVDTQGLDDTKGLDQKNVQQMVQFLRAYPHGVNCVVLVINSQADRLDEGTKKLIRLMNNLFNNPNFWNHVAIVFTKCFHQIPMNKDKKRSEYRQKVMELVREANPDLTPPLPVYFVDSRAPADDKDTKGEFAALHGWVIGLPRLSTQCLVEPNTQFFKVKNEVKTEEKSRVTTPIYSQRDVRKSGMGGWVSVGGSGYRTESYQSGSHTTITYEEHEREVRTHYDGKTISYGDWKLLRTWTQ